MNLNSQDNDSLIPKIGFAKFLPNQVNDWPESRQARPSAKSIYIICIVAANNAWTGAKYATTPL